jgi:hypothetical protein
MRHQQSRDSRIIHTNPNAIAGHAWLRHLEQGIADAITVADADRVIRKSVDREVLAELAERKVIAAERVFPISIRIDLVDHHGALLAAMTAKIALSISLEVQPPDRATSLNRMLPNASVHALAAPLDTLRQTDIDGKQSRHENASLDQIRLRLARLAR